MAWRSASPMPLLTGFADFRQGDGLSNTERRDLTRRLDEIDACLARGDAASRNVVIRGSR